MLVLSKLAPTSVCRKIPRLSLRIPLQIPFFLFEFALQTRFAQQRVTAGENNEIPAVSL